MSTAPQQVRTHSIVELFQHHATDAPGRAALRSGGVGTSYATLAALARSVAAGLHAHRDDGAPVAVLLPRSVAAIATMLGVLQVGRPYLVIDPSFPIDQVKAFLEDAGTQLVVTSHEHMAVAQAAAGPERRLVDLASWSNAAPEDVPLPSVRPATSAALYYTSGSTGRPKGIEWNQTGIVEWIREQATYHEITAADRLSLLFSLSFGASILDLYSALLNGATSCLFDIKQASLSQLADWIDSERITIFHPPVTLFRRLLDALPPERRFPTVRLLILGGDRLDRVDVERARVHFNPDCMITHQLAMTEAGIVARFPMVASTAIPGDVVPVGYPVQGKQVLLLGDDSREVEPGQEGEIVIESPFLSSGYWRRPEQHAHSFRTVPGSIQRRFHTGDRGRIHPDGYLEFLGRRDQLVKIRGHRVELGAVEAALNADPAVRQAVVVARSPNGADMQLVAYVLIAEEAASSVVALRSRLAERLPDYMLPATVMRVDAFPTTATGKIDRKALPNPEIQPLEYSEYVAPRSVLERQLAHMWERVLATPNVSVDADFFAIGGDSLRAVTMLAQVESVTGVSFPPSVMLETPTVKQLAALIETHRESEYTTTSLVELQTNTAGRTSPFFCVHGAGGNVLIFKDLSRYLDREQSFYGLQARGVDRKGDPRETIEEMAAAYIEEIRHVAPHGPYYLGGYSGGGVVAYEMAQQLSEAGDEIALLALIDTFCPTLPPPPKATFTQKLVRHLKRLYRKGPAYGLQFTKNRLKHEGLRIKRTLINGHQKVGKQLPLDLHKIFMRDTFRAAATRYEPKPFEGNVTLFAATKRKRDDLDDDLGWRPYLGSRLRIVKVPGEHGTILREPHVRGLVEALRSELAGTRAVHDAV